jgi:glutamate/tyrosine decarboxylase-like PLP-dependent enzyme
MKTIPEHGIERAEVLARLREFGSGDANYRDSRIWSLVYYLGEEHTSFLKEAYGLYFSENALNPMAFKSLKLMETEIVQMSGRLLNGDEQIVGTLTSGGTETCLLPVATYRDRARASRRLPFKPEMIAPRSIHVAWMKAARYFGVKMVHAPLDENFCVDVAAVEKLINRNTILIAASAPCYPFGAVDPIPALGEVAMRHNLPLHVDACLGGFLLPFVERLGHPVTCFDFRVPGVTSIGADLHKYGFSAKGASVLLYRNMEYLQHQFFVYTDSPTGIFASPAMLGTRPGGAVAAAWAALNAIGLDGYLDISRTIIDTTNRLIKGIESIDGLTVLGRPPMSVFAYSSNDRNLDIYAVGDQLEARGWLVDRIQHPSALHCMVTPGHAGVFDDYLADLREAVDIVRSNPGLAARGNAAMYGMVAHVPLRGLIKTQVARMMADLYGPECKMPAPPGDAPQNSFLERYLLPAALKMFSRWSTRKKRKRNQAYAAGTI